MANKQNSETLENELITGQVTKTGNDGQKYRYFLETGDVCGHPPSGCFIDREELAESGHTDCYRGQCNRIFTASKADALFVLAGNLASENLLDSTFSFDANYPRNDIRFYLTTEDKQNLQSLFSDNTDYRSIDFSIYKILCLQIGEIFLSKLRTTRNNKPAVTDDFLEADMEREETNEAMKETMEAEMNEAMCEAVTEKEFRTENGVNLS